MFGLPRMSATSGCFVQNAWVYLGHDSLSSSKDSHLVKALFEAGSRPLKTISFKEINVSASTSCTTQDSKNLSPTDGCL